MQEYVDMIAVHAFSAFDVTVGIGHGGLPFLAVGIYTFANATCRILNGNVEIADDNVAFLVVAGLGLCRCWLGVYLCRCGLYSTLD